MEDLYTYFFSLLGFIVTTALKFMHDGDISTIFGSQINKGPESLAQSNSFLPFMLDNLHELNYDHLLNNGDPLQVTVNRLTEVFNYFHRNLQQISVIDVFVVVHMFKDYLRHLNISSVQDQKLQTQLKNLIDLADEITVKGGAHFREGHKEYFDAFLPGLAPDAWFTNSTVKPLPKMKFDNVTFSTDGFDGVFSDKCITQMLRCNVTEECWSYMMSPNSSGYQITHQLLYLIIAQSKCLNETKEWIVKFKQESFGKINDVLCSNIYDEASHIKAKHYPEIYRDLFCEQVFVCGMLGYSNFFDQLAMEAIMSWQDKSGCYKYRSAETIIKIPFAKGRVTRTELMISDGCMPHYTVVCAGAFVMYIRTMIMEPTYLQNA